ncbi:hypothetical protein [Qipengyuania sp.]|uniref:hypothetical protein n=1 Tax=Qipengyuania sp. TaxID=2004515 RepID=UPI003BA8D000
MSRRIAILCLLALFSFATAPAGFMPGAAASGPALLICPGSTEIGNGTFAGPRHSRQQTGAMAGHHDHHHAAPGDSDDKAEADAGNAFCDYGTQAQADVPPSPVASGDVQPYIRTELLPASPLTTIFPAALPPSTGPPRHS